MIRPKRSIGLWLMLLIVLLPFLILYQYGRTFFVVGDSYTTLTVLAKTAGIVGMMTLSLNVFLSARYKFLEHLFGGMDYVYRVHRVMGKIAFPLLIVHALLVGLRYLQIDPSFILDFYFDFSTYLVVGKLALGLLTAVIVITIYVRLPYHILKRIHQLMGVVILLAGVHVYLVPSDVLVIYPLRVYMLAWIGLALISYVHRSWLGGPLFKRYQYIVKEINSLRGGITEIVLRPKDRKKVMRHIAGQFQFIRFFQPGFSREEHPFTISSAEGERYLRLSVKNSGDYTENMDDLEVGTVAKSEGPFGGFSYRNAKYKEQIWIAGGIGITPFLSMARTLAKKRNFGRYAVSLFYTYSEPKDAAFAKELREIAKKNDNFTLYPVCSSKKGRLTAQNILDTVDRFKEKEIYICGPGAMIESYRTQLVDLGVKKKYIRYEEFKLL